VPVAIANTEDFPVYAYSGSRDRKSSVVVNDEAVELNWSRY
jgi:hypothetical protein